MTSHSFPVFLSSLCKRAPGLKDLRAAAFEDIGQRKLIYVDERVKHRNVATQDDLDAADELIGHIRKASQFVCILAGSSHGTPIDLGGLESRTSFFEVELYQAVLTNKTVHLLVREDFLPEPKLAELLKSLGGVFPTWFTHKRLSDKQIYAAIQRIVDRRLLHHASVLSSKVVPPVNRLIQMFYSSRTSPATQSQLLFLDGTTDRSGSLPRPAILDSVLNELKHESNEEKRLSRIWIGMRELTVLNPLDDRSTDFLPYWNALLGEWSSAGSWYGLHADMPLGVLAALNSLVHVRERLRVLGSTASEEFGYPGGALASAKYSIAKRLIRPSDRTARFHSALADIEQALNTNPLDPSGLYAIRGSILRQQGLLSDAIEDYKRALRLKRDSGAPLHAIGDAQSELGFAHILHLDIFTGLRLCREGVENLRTGARPGFLVRGLRKLAVANLLSGRLPSAYKAYEEARAIASTFSAFDQLP